MKKLIISKGKKNTYTGKDVCFDFYAVYKNEKLIYLDIYGGTPSPGDVYVAEVMEKAGNIGAYFLKLSDKEKGFLKTDKTLSIGSKVLVQVRKEKTKSKCALVSDAINLTGAYMVID